MKLSSRKRILASPGLLQRSCHTMLLLVLASCYTTGQTPANSGDAAKDKISAPQQNSALTSLAGNTQAAPCVQPEELFSVDDYNGPFRKTVAYFSRKLEIKTVHAPPHNGKGLCRLSPSGKFRLFVSNNLEPVTFVAAGFNAGVAQAANDDPTFGQGMAGYGKRYGAALADTASSDFFHTFLFPVIFKQDPRYYRRLEGTTGQRLGRALSHVFVARSDSGHRMFNFSEWLGTISSTSLSNTYHPGNRRGIGPAAERVGISIGTDMGFDVLREFWPEAVRVFHLPFRQRDDVPAPASKTVKK